MKLLIFVALTAALVATSLALKNEICGLPHSANGYKDTGITCRALLYDYTYDSSANKCIMFTYGGCGGNANRFITKESCEEKCLE
ncbi:male accessory gland serine protease inhibitor-like [Drosophila serrata]|uniref:male accessory gland serine protease inhibitor-like n=1 Tax=Drosophila serrata TaxID=7274 RepID=UPI000A1D30FC|nr:male accessory gland serine protease inhibitor-like [Drosophila serrata]